MRARSSESREVLEEALRRLTERALTFIPRRGGPGSAGNPAQIVTPRAGLVLLRQDARTTFEAHIYDPMLCLILQGCKEMTFGERHFRLRAGQCALVSHDLPIVSRVREAPYLVLLLDIDVEVLRSLYDDLGELAGAETDAQALEVHEADPQLLEAISRLLALSESEADARVLGPMCLKEVHYRLVASPLGHMLRRLLRRDSHASAVARAIACLRRDFRSPIAVAQLARTVGMSVASFHKQFKAITASSPLQYQKGLRLLEARRMLVAGTASVATVAFEVGYQSPSQFSREYARKFGRPPSHDAAKPARGSRGPPRASGSGLDVESGSDSLLKEQPSEADEHQLLCSPGP